MIAEWQIETGPHQRWGGWHVLVIKRPADFDIDNPHALAATPGEQGGEVRIDPGGRSGAIALGGGEVDGGERRNIHRIAGDRLEIGRFNAAKTLNLGQQARRLFRRRLQLYKVELVEVRQLMS